MVSTRLFPAFQKELPRQDGKVFAITGTTSGTGFVAAQTAAQAGGTVLLLNRPSSRATESLQRLREAVPDAEFVPIECDLQDFASVRNAVAEIRSKYEKLYCLCNNAGIMATPDKATKDGYDMQMQTNHLSHFLLTAELFPLLKKQAEETGDARVVNHSSMARLVTSNKCLEKNYLQQNGDGNLGGDQLGFMSGPCFERYSQTKLANSIFTHALHQKIQATASTKNKIRACCAHPGGSHTNLSNGLQFGLFGNMAIKLAGPFLFQTAEDGAMGILRGMMDPEAVGGTLYGPKGTRGEAVALEPRPFENDEKAMEMLWKCSEEATAIQFEIE